MNLFGLMTVFAETGENTGAAGIPMGGILLVVGWVAIFYFILIRPQRKKDKQAKQLIESIKVGDQVVTIGGIIGKIIQLKDDTMLIETGSINDKSTIKLSRGALKEVTKSKNAPAKDNKEIVEKEEKQENQEN